MPQLDKVTFFSQIIWLLITFLSLYILSSRVIIPIISRNIILRRVMLQDKQHLDNKDSSIKSNTDQSVELSLYSDLGSLNSLINSMISSNKEYVKLELSKILSNSINPMSTYSSEAGINSLVSSSAVYKKVRS